MVRDGGGGGGGWKWRECSRLRELQQVQRPVVGSTAVHSRTRNKVSVMRCFFSKCCLSVCLCVGPWAEHREPKDGLISAG